MEGVIPLLVTGVLSMVASAIIAVIGGRYGLFGKQEETAGKRIESEATIEAKKIDDAAAIRRELREEVSKFRETIEKLNAKVEQLTAEKLRDREHVSDLLIIIRNLIFSADECADIFADLLNAEQLLDEGYKNKVKAILKSLHNDREAIRRLRVKYHDEGPHLVNDGDNIHRTEPK